MILGPTLTAERVTLRPPRESDFDALCAFGRSEERTRFLGGLADANAQWRTLLADIGHWVLRGYGLFSIEVSDTGRFVGRAGPIFHHHNDEPELAWHLFEGFDGQGFASEAAAAARDWYYDQTGHGPLMSWINRDNHASQAVARRLGAVPERADRTASGHEGHIWRHQKP
ncbi:GNAT family N-acetyltransferase [Rubellimicrobium roseum]|uniref:GNAT family N-acetyltransferase n=1 Tax=Rubellimicrobium roseum TaxID=687525 RepID=A0A5C4N8G4_9RHOB|nr:GNAT family N-acetyltransferase [Rubellimicrobium roseum]TNC61183.1 GNAT family N-acetyltransferase [Rubellimicrobium roseum]